MKTWINTYGKRKIQSLIIAVFCVIFIDRVPSWLVSYGVRYLLSHGLYVQQIYLLDEMQMLSSLLSIIKNIGSFICAVLILCLRREIQSRANGQFFIERKHILQLLDVKRLCLSGAIGAGAVQIVIFCMTLLPEDIQAAYNTSMGTALNESTASFLSLFAIAHIIVAPVTEEVIFRGVLYDILRNSWGRIPCILLASFLFAGTHGNMIQMVYAFFMGMLLCMIREAYGSILYTSAFHMIFNLFGSGLVFPEQTIYLMYPGITIFVISIILFVSDVKKANI